MTDKKHLQLSRLESFERGWVVGNFSPTLLQTNDFEVAVKSYVSGDYEARHVHKIATEYSIVVTGKYRMNDTVLEAGDIVTLTPGVDADFLCLEPGKVAVIKVPSVANDKFIIERSNEKNS